MDFSNYDSVATKFGVNNFLTTFDYISENNEIGNSEVISNETKYNFTKEHSLQFNTTKDLKDDFTQFYKFTYEYETDCLLASFEYEKKFFRDGSLIPDENLLFLIRFIPFAEVRGGDVGKSRTSFAQTDGSGSTNIGAGSETARFTRLNWSRRADSNC